MSVSASAPGQSRTRKFPTVEAFESGTLDPEAFDHEAHLYVAWKLLQECSLAEATQRFLAALKRLTRMLNQESKYHETISCFYMTVIAERSSRVEGQNWPGFARANRDLLVSSQVFLDHHYSHDRLWSDLARRQFLLPDRYLGAGNDKSI